MFKRVNPLIGLLICLLLIGCYNNQGLKVTDGVYEESNQGDGDMDFKVKLVTGEYLPYTSPQLADLGFFTQMVMRVMEESDIPYEIAFYPWARCSEMVKQGQAWGSFPYGQSPYNDANYLYTKPLVHTTHRFYYLSTNTAFVEAAKDWTQLDQFVGFTFGGTGGYWYGNQRELEALGLDVEWTNDTDALIKMLYAGRIDFFIEDERVCEEAVARLFEDRVGEIASLFNPAKEQDYYLIISKDYQQSTEYLEKFNEALDRLMDSGGFDDLINP